VTAKGFTLLWSKILDSSIWMEAKETRLVWITMLAMKDAEGKILAVPKALAHRARVSEEECRRALEVLLSPDPESSTQVEDGRRVREIAGGWEIVNHELYRFSTEAKRAFWREQKAQQRAVKVDGRRKKRGGGLPGEETYLKMERAGEDVSLEPGNKIPEVGCVVESKVEENVAKAQKWIPEAGQVGKETGANQPAGAEGEAESAEEELRRLREEG
jgi:hypothetical protein